jgi:CheY-like chemotaxis protein
MNKPTLAPRILLIEDNPERIVLFRDWLQGSEFVLIEASSGGRAKGILKKGSTDGIAGVMLDHDLDQQPMTASDLLMSASNLIDSIVSSIPRSVPILIHSMNASKPPVIQRRLKSEGFSVTRIRMTALTRENFYEWLQDVRDNWEEPE